MLKKRDATAKPPKEKKEKKKDKKKKQDEWKIEIKSDTFKKLSSTTDVKDSSATPTPTANNNINNNTPPPSTTNPTATSTATPSTTPFNPGATRERSNTDLGTVQPIPTKVSTIKQRISVYETPSGPHPSGKSPLL